MHFSLSLPFYPGNKIHLSSFHVNFFLAGFSIKCFNTSICLFLIFSIKVLHFTLRIRIKHKIVTGPDTCVHIIVIMDN